MVSWKTLNRGFTVLTFHDGFLLFHPRSGIFYAPMDGEHETYIEFIKGLNCIRYFFCFNAALNAGCSYRSGKNRVFFFLLVHCDSEPLEIGTKVLGHSLVRSLIRSHRSLVRSHRSLVRLLRTARFARAPLCSFACSLAHSLAPPSSWETGSCL